MADAWYWPHVCRAEKAIRYLTRLVRRGGLVALPSESGPVVVASTLASDAVTRLRDLFPETDLELLVEGRAAACDWVPDLGAAGRRIADKLWPGPVAVVSTEGVERGLAGCLPEAVRAAIVGPNGLTLRRLLHPAAETLRRRLAEPLLCVPAGRVRESLEQELDLVVEDSPTSPREVSVVQVAGATWNLLREGATSKEDIEARFARVIVFVCTGNTCRSPMAEAICKRLLAERLGCGAEELPAQGWVITSAGLGAMEGMPAAREAVEVARTHGGDLSAHQSKPLSEELAHEADLVLGMTQGHVRALREALPSHPTGPRLLSQEGDDIDDPIGQPAAAYEACARQMRACIETLLAELG